MVVFILSTNIRTCLHSLIEKVDGWTTTKLWPRLTQERREDRGKTDVKKNNLELMNSVTKRIRWWHRPGLNLATPLSRTCSAWGMCGEAGNACEIQS